MSQRQTFTQHGRVIVYRPSARRGLTAALAAAIAATSFASVARAQSTPASTGGTAAGEIVTSQYSFVGEVNADDTVIYSGPNDGDYAILKLKKGTQITVVGTRFDWLKIEPPPGSFCLVSQAFVEKRGDGTVGRVANKAFVRIGSTLSTSKHNVPRQLEPDTDVTILGELDEFYKIVPPAGVFMYVDKRYVVPVRRVDEKEVVTPGGVATRDEGMLISPAPSGAEAAPPTGASTPTADATKTVGVTDDGNTFVAKSQTPPIAAATVAGADATAAAIAALQEKLSKLEDRYAAAGQQELGQQPLDGLAADYDALLAEKQLPPNARRVAEYRASQLKLRKEALAQFAAARKVQEEAAARQQQLETEQATLQAQVAKTQVKRYAAVGRLMTSSLQVGGQPLYRLVDPANGRLIVYLRAAKMPIADGLDKFVGVNGQVVRDEAMRLTYVQPSATLDVVDPKLVNTKVFADHTPASLAPAANTSVAGSAE